MNSQPVDFVKLEALGNDFVLIDGRAKTVRIDPQWVASLADRRRGIGFDQLLVVHSADQADHQARVEIFNADGSRAKQCGNGMRAIALWLTGRDQSGPIVRLETEGGLVALEVRDGQRICANLPPPRQIGPDQSAELFGHRVRFGEVDLGNRHVVIDWPGRPSADEVEKVGRTVQQWPGFADGVNVGLAFLETARLLTLAVWERGAGPTPACGSAACAAAARLIASRRAQTPLTIRQPGGSVVVSWTGGQTDLQLTGAARIVFQGTIASTT